MSHQLNLPLEEETWDLSDNLDIPDAEIEYQEDDGNSNCDGGACTI
jgi:hypothetical protein